MSTTGDLTAAAISLARDSGHLLLMNAGTWANTIRFMPPLVVDESEVTTALSALTAALAATA